MTQGDPLYPTIFKVVVHTFICHWVAVVEETKEVMERIELLIRDIETYFNADDGIVASTQLERL